MFTIEKNIPIPAGKGRGARKGELRLTMERLEVGDSIVVTNKHRQGIHQIAKAIGIDYVTRTICKDSGEVRVWRTK